MALELMGMFPDELKAFLNGFSQPAFRAEQIFMHLHRGLRFDEMLNIPKSLRDDLMGKAVDQPVEIMDKRVSKLDGTVKFLFSLRDGHCVEGVLMDYHHGYSLCISTQVGCRMGCKFCASTLDGCERNLTAAEILGQVHCANREIMGSHVGNIVLMGSGEPFDNYDNVVRFLRLVSHEKGLGIGLRHISLSTCGIVPQMRKFALEGLPVTLSVSLHAPNDDIRKQLMPVASAYSIADLLEACRYYIEKTGRRVIFEYALIAGVNSSVKHAVELASRLRGMQCHVNLIALNSVSESELEGADENKVSVFERELNIRNISVTRRREMGDDIQGACGQLRKSHIEARASLGGISG
jgi:23S rRNA (adenine2503-C2)-methyltransferase